MKTIKMLCVSVKALPSFFAILLMCFAGFAFAQDVMEGSKKAREEGSVPDTSITCCEGGMAPPVSDQTGVWHVDHVFISPTCEAEVGSRVATGYICADNGAAARARRSGPL